MTGFDMNFYGPENQGTDSQGQKLRSYNHVEVSRHDDCVYLLTGDSTILMSLSEFDQFRQKLNDL